MACTKYTLEQYTAFNEAISQGVLEVHYFDKTVKYRSLEEMLRIQGLMEQCLFPERFKNNGRVYPSYSKGTFGRGGRNGCR